MNLISLIETMSGKNRWLDDDDDDFTSTSKGTDRWGDDNVEDFDPNKDYMTQVVERKQDNMLESTYRSLRMLDESERVGAATGEVIFRLKIYFMYSKSYIIRILNMCTYWK